MDTNSDSITLTNNGYCLLKSAMESNDIRDVKKRINCSTKRATN